jgi:capsular polysaccharide transport system permease protein
MKSLIDLSPRALKVIIIGLPLLAAATYLTLFAADRYVSESTVALRQAGGEGGALPGAALLLAGVTPPARQDSLYLAKYIQSRALIDKLDQEFKLRDHYTSARLDPVYRLQRESSEEDFLEYFRQRVQVSFDDASSLLTVRVQAFDPAFAQRLNRRLLQAGEDFVNDSSRRIARDLLQFSEGEAKTASDRVQAAKSQLLTFQSKHRLLDPVSQAQATGMITAELQGALSRRQTELKTLRSYLTDEAPQVQSLQNEVQALQSQIGAERNRATRDGRDGERMNALAADFQGLRLRVDFAVDAYKLALSAVENARVEATRKLKTLVVIEPPTLPQTAEYPLRIYNLVTVLVACLLLYAIVRLVLATIREHQD